MITIQQAPDTFYNVEVEIAGAMITLLIELTDEQYLKWIAKDLERAISQHYNVEGCRVWGLTKVKEVIRIQ